METTSNVTASSTSLRKHIEESAIRQFNATTYFYKAAEGGGERRSLNRGDHSFQFNVMNSSNATIDDIVLAEGVTPEGRGITFSPVIPTISQYGDFAEISDLAARDNPFPLIEESAYELGRKFGLLVDAIVQTQLILGTQTIIRTAADVTTTRGSLVAADVFKAKRLAEARAKLSTNFVPEIGQGYVAFIHPNVIFDLHTESGTGTFVDVNKYARPEEILKGEIGKLYGVRVVEAKNITVLTGAGAGGINVYPSYIVGRWAYGVVVSQDMETFYKDFGSGGTTDPLNQRATVGMKARFGATILKDQSIVRVESSSSIG